MRRNKYSALLEGGEIGGLPPASVLKVRLQSLFQALSGFIVMPVNKPAYKPAYICLIISC